MVAAVSLFFSVAGFLLPVSWKFERAMFGAFATLSALLLSVLLPLVGRAFVALIKTDDNEEAHLRNLYGGTSSNDIR